MRNLDTIGPRRSLIAPVLAGTLALLVAACGGATPTPPPAEAAVDQAEIDAAIDDLVAGAGIDISSDDEDAEAAPAIEPVSIALGQEAWFAGFHVTFGDLTIEPEGRRGDLAIAATFENLGEDEARLDATIVLESGGQPVPESFDMDIPRVPSGDSVDGTFGFSIDDEFTLDDAVLTLGTPAVQQVVVPLGAAAGEFVGLEPMPLALTGSGTTGQIELKLDGGDLRADTPDNHGQMEAGKLALTVNYSATNHGTSAADFVFASENVHLRLPDGTEIGTINDGRSQSIAGIASGTTARDLMSRFEIDDPAAGQYMLLVIDGDAIGEIPITIP
jgi:hypothetical protein